MRAPIADFSRMNEPYATAASLDSLIASIRGCTLCASQLPLGAKPIFQVDSRARVLIAAQAPGRKAHLSGKPFDDPSGERLRAWLGVDRDAFYDPSKFAIVPMGFCYPGGARGGDFPPRPECAQRWRRQVLASLSAIGLTLVVGNHALRWHLGVPKDRSLADTVRDWQSHWPALVPMPHPSPRNQRWLRQQPWFEATVLPRVRQRIAELIV
jgi:uracil-DNA glycosylase